MTREGNLSGVTELLFLYVYITCSAALYNCCLYNLFIYLYTVVYITCSAAIPIVCSIAILIFTFYIQYSHSILIPYFCCNFAFTFFIHFPIKISLIVWKLCAFRQGSNIVNFQQFFTITFD